MPWFPFLFAALEVADESIVMGSNRAAMDAEHGGLGRERGNIILCVNWGKHPGS